MSTKGLMDRYVCLLFISLIFRAGKFSTRQLEMQSFLAFHISFLFKS